MTDTPEPRIWDIENPDITPDEYLVGCCQQRWVADEESQMAATGVVLAQVFMAAGMTAEDAIDNVPQYLERGVTVSLTDEGLSFAFGDADGEPEGE